MNAATADVSVRAKLRRAISRTVTITLAGESPPRQAFEAYSAPAFFRSFVSATPGWNISFSMRACVSRFTKLSY